MSCVCLNIARAQCTTQASMIRRTDALQHQFLREAGLNERVAFLEHNLAPLQFGRGIAMSGLIQRCVRREAHPQFIKLLPMEDQSRYTHFTKTSAARHDQQLINVAASCRLGVIRRSALGLIKVYNLFPQQVIDSMSVKGFQQTPVWQERFSPSAQHSTYQHIAIEVMQTVTIHSFC